MESIIDNERDEARGVEREPADRPTPRELAANRCPDIAGRDIAPNYEPGPDDIF
jgi:hypothetical protein